MHTTWHAVGRSLAFTQASINGEVLGRFDSEPGSTYTTLGVGITGVHTLTFKTVGLAEDEWISLNEVSKLLMMLLLVPSRSPTPESELFVSRLTIRTRA